MENALEKKNIKKYKNSKLIDVLTKKKQNLSKEKIFQEIYNKQETDEKRNSKNSKKNNSDQKMTLKFKQDTINEIFQNEPTKEKKKKVMIFNNKKNNGICSDLLKSAVNTEKELLYKPYPKEKQKVNKTLNTIGRANGISYPITNVINGILTQDKNYMAIIRDDHQKKYNNKNHKVTISKLKYSTAEIDLNNKMEDNDSNNLKNMLNKI